MDGLYWLIALLIIAAGAYAAHYWYHRPSGMPEILLVSYSYQTLEYMDHYARRIGEDPGEYDISIHTIAFYMKRRKLGWRQRNDIVGYVNKIGWVHEFNEEGVRNYRITKAGKQELETASGLGGAVREAAQTLHDKGISGDQAKATAAAVVAAALRVQARSSSPETNARAEASADDIEKAVETHDPAKIDRAITRTKDILQIMKLTYSLPFMREILRIFGL
jgi:hypothetical protein